MNASLSKEEAARARNEAIEGIMSLKRSNPIVTEPVTESHFGADVSVNPLLERMRAEDCLCLNCGKLNPNPSKNCPVAQSLYEICVRENVAMAMTRCPNWTRKAA